MNSEKQITLSSIYEFLQKMEKEHSERLRALEEKIVRLDNRHDEIKTAFAALFSNEHDYFSSVEFQIKGLEMRMMQAFKNDENLFPSNEDEL